MTKKCSFGFISPCSTSSEENSLFQIRACLKSTRNHLGNLNCEFDRDIPEGLLILLRSGLYSVDSSVLKYLICEKHRVELGTHWRRPQMYLKKFKFILYEDDHEINTSYLRLHNNWPNRIYEEGCL